MADKLELNNKLEKWLNSEGYPLEFRTAIQFRKAGFSVHQGEYTRDIKSGMPREIDVVADISMRPSGSDITCRVSFLIECKYVKEPWVIFTSKRAIAPSACMAQTIASPLGEAVLWCLAGDNELSKSISFSEQEKTGFNLVQAFKYKEDKKELAYFTLQKIISAAYDKANAYKDSLVDSRYCNIIFPMVVMKGKLFEANYDNVEDIMKVKEIPCIRMHWRGAEAWKFHATVDIVTSEYLEIYSKERFVAAVELQKRLTSSRKISLTVLTKDL